MTFFEVLTQSFNIIKKDKIVMAPGLLLAFIVTLGVPLMFSMPNATSSLGLDAFKPIIPAFLATLVLELFFLTFTLLIGHQLMTSDIVNFDTVQDRFLTTFLRILSISSLLTLPFIAMYTWLIYPQTQVLVSDSPSAQSMILLAELLVFFVGITVAAIVSNIGQVISAGRQKGILDSISFAWYLLRAHSKSSLLLICYSICVKWLLTLISMTLVGIPVIGQSVSILVQGFEHCLGALMLLHLLHVGNRSTSTVV